MAYEYDYLTPEHKLNILRERKLNIEAEHFGQDLENKLAKQLGMEGVEQNTEIRRAQFESALEFLTKEIRRLEAEVDTK